MGERSGQAVTGLTGGSLRDQWRTQVLEAGRCRGGPCRPGVSDPVVELRAEIAGMDVGDHPPPIAARRQEASDQLHPSASGSGPATSTIPFTGGPTASSAMAAATSSDAIGCR